MQKVSILQVLNLDPEAMKKLLEDAVKLEDNQEFFEQLTTISYAKKLVADALEEVEKFESEAKGLINAKAKALYGDDWRVIKGDNFKISRSLTGSVYKLIDPDTVDPEYLKVTFSPDTKAIDGYREVNDSKLPEGVTINEKRNESLRITVNEDNKA